MGVGEVDLERVGARNAAVARAAYMEGLEPQYCNFDPVEPKLHRNIGSASIADILVFPSARVLAIAVQCAPGPILLDDLREKVAEVYGYKTERARGIVGKGVHELVQRRVGSTTMDPDSRYTRYISFDLGDNTFSPIGSQSLEITPHPEDELNISEASVRNPVASATRVPRSRRHEQQTQAD